MLYQVPDQLYQVPNQFAAAHGTRTAAISANRFYIGPGFPITLQQARKWHRDHLGISVTCRVGGFL